MKHFSYTLAALLLSALTATLHAQEHRERDIDPETGEDKTQLELFIRNRAFPGDQENNFGRYAEEMTGYRDRSQQLSAASWTEVDASGSFHGDVGRTSSVTFDPFIPNRFYVCTPYSGVWRTDDNGITYTPITENLATQSTSGLLIDPVNPQVMYLATGCSHMDLRSNSIGIYKTTDGGVNWSATLVFQASAGIRICKMIMNPENHLSILAATSNGIYKTIDGGTGWTLQTNVFATSIAYCPSDTQLVFAAGHSYLRSADGGVSFTTIANGVFQPFNWFHDYTVASTAADSQQVYLVTSGLMLNGVFKQYLHRSTDYGQSFMLIDSLIGHPQAQFALSNQHAEKMLLGFYGIYKRENLAAPFTAVTSTMWNSPVFVHSDQRGMFFDPQSDSIIYICNDGGLYRSTDNGTSFQVINGNMQLANLYTFSQSQQQSYKILTAPLDVPPYMIGASGISTSFLQMVEAFSANMSPFNDSIYNVGHQYLNFTNDDGNSFYTSQSQLLTNVIGQPNAFQYLGCNEAVSYFGCWNEVYKSTDYGHTYQQIGSTGFNPVNTFQAQLRNLVVCRSDNQRIYAGYEHGILRSTDGGVTFVNITGNLPVSSAIIQYITADHINANHVWVTFSGYSSGNKVFFSNDGGQTWNNFSSGLPNVPVNMIVCQDGVPGAVYAAVDGGVFYRDSTFSSWQPYNTNLPALIVTAIDIQAADNKVRISTFGRGIWESPVYQATPVGYLLPPVAGFTHDLACAGAAVQFDDISCGAVTSWQWFFPGAVPSASNASSVSVVYPNAGVYAVTLVVSGPGGTDTLYLPQAVSITPSLALPYIEDVPDLNYSYLPAGMHSIETNGDGYNWDVSFIYGSSGIFDDCILYDNFQHYLGGEEDLVLPLVDLSLVTNAKLYFKHAYAERNVSIPLVDTLIVKAQACGGSDTVLWRRGGSQLATVNTYYPFGSWIPYDTLDWLQDSVDLSLFAGERALRISFGNLGHWGQAIYLDAFRVNGVALSLNNAATNPENGFALYPNPAGEYVSIVNASGLPDEIRLEDVQGRLLQKLATQQNRSLRIYTGNLAPGVYLVHAGETVIRFTRQ